VVGAQVKILEIGDVPCAGAKLASEGTPLAESVKVCAGVEVSEAVTVKLIFDV